MSAGPPSFDRLARVYRALELSAFGCDLERARFCFLDRLRGCRDILVLGEGDGRCLARLATAAPGAHIHVIDASAAMLGRAGARIAGTEARERVTFERADMLVHALPRARYDAVLTMFFLDCFTAEQAAGIVARAQASLQPGAAWLFADFVLPARGVARRRAQAWLAVLYFFFRRQTALTARALPPSEEILAQAGFHCESRRDFQHGFVRSALFRRDDSGPVTAA